MSNLFDNLPRRRTRSSSRSYSDCKDAQIERIVSTGQSTAMNKPYIQDHDEWVLLVSGSAGLWVEGEGERKLRPGDYILISSHRAHRVTWTSKGEPTVWLAVHFS